MFFSSAIELLLPVSTYLVFLLAVLCLRAFWRARRQNRRRPWLLLFCTVWAWVLSTPALANLWTRQLEGPPPRADALSSAAVPVQRQPGSLVVVLASGEVSIRGGQLRAQLDAAGWERVTAGVSLWRQTGGKLLLTGGRSGSGAPVESLADVMARLARDMGVPADAILISDGSSRTSEDMDVAAPLIRQQPGPVWLVTSALHMRRSLAVAQRLGLQVRAFPCDYRQLEQPGWQAWLPNAGGAGVFASVMHEALGLAYYRLRGWAA